MAKTNKPIFDQQKRHNFSPSQKPCETKRNSCQKTTTAYIEKLKKNLFDWKTLPLSPQLARLYEPSQKKDQHKSDTNDSSKV